MLVTSHRKKKPFGLYIYIYIYKIFQSRKNRIFFIKGLIQAFDQKAKFFFI